MVTFSVFFYFFSGISFSPSIFSNISTAYFSIYSCKVWSSSSIFFFISYNIFSLSALSRTFYKVFSLSFFLSSFYYFLSLTLGYYYYFKALSVFFSVKICLNLDFSIWVHMSLSSYSVKLAKFSLTTWEAIWLKILAVFTKSKT